MVSRNTYSTQVANWLKQMGYTHCFFLAGGNIMHLLDAAREAFVCIPVVHEVSAGIATEYFNEISSTEKAFALVTAGPGLTNIMTAAAGAFTEGRELLVIGGQVKSSDLSRGEIRQRGIQEVDGIALMAPVCKTVLRVEAPIPRSDFEAGVRDSFEGKPGPVFIEMCLDAQGSPCVPDDLARPTREPRPGLPQAHVNEVATVADLLLTSERPLLLLGGGLSYEAAVQHNNELTKLGIPIATTYNGSDRFGSDSPLYFGRPNTWGMRWANVLIQQADVIVALGTRLGLQQTGFNWQEFGSLANIVQVDIDSAEITKGHPRVAVPVVSDAKAFLAQLLAHLHSLPATQDRQTSWRSWTRFGNQVRELLPLNDLANSVHPGFWNPYDFVEQLGALAQSEDVIIPCSSGGAFTATYQALLPKFGQRIVSNKSLASMGYGLAGAIGAAFARPNSRILHVEGDGGFAQNLQELGTVAVHELDIKTFIWVNDGYASIRMTQRNYFDGAWVGCDRGSGVGLPDWERLTAAYGLACHTLDPATPLSEGLGSSLAERGPVVYLVPIHPDQTFFPKINSRITESGSMLSNPLHSMSPDLPSDIRSQVMKYLGES